MNPDALSEARAYEMLHEKSISPDDRPVFHVSSRIGWMNDPNGFSFYHGYYHLFYQYHPYRTVWGPMHWGHVRSKDLLHWEFLPTAIAPDTDYDKNGCYSGSALELKDGRQLLMYTSVQKESQPDGTIAEFQTQSIAFGDGIDYVKSEHNPILTSDLLPAGASTKDFRDPKIWRDDMDQCYYAVVGSILADSNGAVLLFCSDDLIHWSYVSTLEESRQEYGSMWECPDFFILEQSAVILASPTSMYAKDLEFHNGHNAVYSIGSYNRITHSFTRREVRTLDYGLDFYAAQTMLSPNGRRIMIGWMQSWDNCHKQPKGCRYFGMMTVPRELFLHNGYLCQLPVRELSDCHKNTIIFRQVSVSSPIELNQLKGRVLDMTIQIRPSKDQLYDHCFIHLASDGKLRTTICYDPRKSILHFDRTYSGFLYDLIAARDVSVRNRNGCLDLRIVMDRFSVEIFVNGGEQAITSVIHTPQSADRIILDAEGTVLMDIEKSDLNITI